MSPRPNTEYGTVADILNLPAWPSEQLRLIVERADGHRGFGQVIRPSIGLEGPYG